MAYADRTEQLDIFPMLIVGLVVIYLFFLVRPPVSMFWRYGLGMGSSMTDPLVTKPDPTDPAPSSQQPAPPIKLPAVPNMLEKSVGTWPKAPLPAPEIEMLGKTIERLTNQERQKYGRPELPIDPALRTIATQHSWDMLQRNYRGHVSPDKVSSAQRVGKYHRRLFGVTREHMAEFSSGPVEASEFVEMWMNSPGHRDNLLTTDVSHAATGCFNKQEAKGLEKRLCTQLFSQTYATAEHDVPETVNIGQTIDIRIRASEGLTMPTRLDQVDLRTGIVPSAADLTPSGEVVVGKMTFNGPPGVYVLQLTVPDTSNPNSNIRSSTIVPGPYVTVR